MVSCWVPRCNHYSEREFCRFLVFPKDKKERKKWLQLIRRVDEPGNGARVCSCHFRDGNRVNRPELLPWNKGKLFGEDYLNPEKRPKRRRKQDLSLVPTESQIIEPVTTIKAEEPHVNQPIYSHVAYNQSSTEPMTSIKKEEPDVDQPVYNHAAYYNECSSTLPTSNEAKHPYVDQPTYSHSMVYDHYLSQPGTSSESVDPHSNQPTSDEVAAQTQIGYKSKSVRSCIFMSCDNSSATTPQKIFVGVPTNLDKRQLWFEAAGRARIKKGTYFCCEDHFDFEKDASNWIYFRTLGNRLILKEGVIPRQQERKTCTSQFTLSDRRAKAQILQSMQRNSTVSVPVAPKLCKSLVTKWTMTAGIVSENKEIMVRPTTSERATNTERAEISRSSDSTSAGSLEEETVFLDIDMSDVFSNVELDKIRENTRLYLGLPESDYFIVQQLEEHMNLPLENIFITLKKIKTNDQFQRLAMDFSKSLTEVLCIFKNSAPIIATKLNELISWPDKDQTQDRTPFKLRFKRVQGIIDCFEVRIQQPTDQCDDDSTFNPYKYYNTIKFFLSTTPKGLITYVSPGFPGTTPISQMFDQSGFTDFIPKDSAIMVDKAFEQVAPALRKKRVSLICFPKDHSIKKMTKIQTVKLQLGANGRNYTEQVLKRVQEFRMLGTDANVEHEMVPFLQYAAVIACAIVNVRLIKK